MANTFELLPPLVFVMETQTPPGGFIEQAVEMKPEELEGFFKAWQRLHPHVVAHVSRDSLLRISRWAVAEMKNLSLPVEWPAKIPLRLIAASRDQRLIRFGQFKEEGFPLPSHHPLVFRRLLLYVDYDRTERRVVQINVTINGWVEE